jgi:hypothetical protein
MIRSPRVRPCHSAATVLLGWYLLLPPGQTGGGGDVVVDAEAPIGRWKSSHAYDSAAECERAKESMLKSLGALAESKNRGERTTLTALPLSQCVASDDPRLAK